MTETPAPDGEALAKFFAKQVLQGFPGSKTVKQGAVDEVELANRIGEIEIETQIAGASYLKAHIIDPEWALTISGWLKVKEGLLQPIEVEFPEGSKWFWILCAVEGSTNVTEPNLTVTFEDRIVYFLRQYYGKKYAPPGIQTRAQFIRGLVQEVGQHGEEKAGFICPSLNVVQLVETEGEEESKKTKTDEARQESEEKVAKRGGLGAGSFTIEGSPATRQQALDVSTAIQTAQRLKAPPRAVEALIAAGIAESGFKREASENNEANNPHKGIWQSDVIPPNEVGKQAEFFLKGGESFASGGAIERANNKSLTIAQICIEVEGAEPSAALEGRLKTAITEAQNIIRESGGAKPVVEESVSDVSQLQRGTSANPDEDSFECAVRLATQVDWFFFSDNHNFYCMDGPTFMRQKPALYVDIPRNHVKTPRGESSYGGVLSPSTFTFDNCFTLSTLVPTPSGMKTIGELRRGMFVYGANGEPTRIAHHSQTIHDEPCYRLEFDDGSAFETNGAHLWETKPRDGELAIRTTLELLGTISDDHQIELAPRPSGRFITLTNVSPIPSAPVRCFEVEASDHLFVVGENWAVSHQTTYEYRISHKLKTRVQRKSRAVKPASPAEVKLLLECGVDEFHAGEVFKFENSGPIDGVWIITNTRRECLLNTYTEIILEPPIEPLPEPRSTSGASEVGENAAGSTGLKGAVEIAEKTVNEQEKSPNTFKYVYGGGRGEGASIFGASPREMDCSSYTELVFKAAGLPDPSGLNYNPIGTTETLIKGCTKVGNPTPGCLCFYGKNGKTEHVAIYIGNGKVANMGGAGDPKIYGYKEVEPETGDFMGYYKPKET